MNSTFEKISWIRMTVPGFFIDLCQMTTKNFIRRNHAYPDHEA